MLTRSRALRDSAVRALAKVGLIWAVAVLGFVFTASAAVGSASTAPADAAHSFAFVNTGEAPRTAGLALALVVLAAGLTVLAVGALRRPSETGASTAVPRLAAPADLSLPLAPELAPVPSAA